MRVLFLCLVFLLALIPEIAAKIPNPYKVLGISQNANDDEIRDGFKKRSKKYHPDRNKKDPRAKEKFEKIANAYELLKDPERRRIFDMTGDDNPQAQQGGHGFPGGGFGFPGGGFGGIDIEELMRQGFFQQGHPGGHGHGHGHGHAQGGQRRQQRQTTYSFSFGGGEGIRF